MRKLKGGGDGDGEAASQGGYRAESYPWAQVKCKNCSERLLERVA